MRHRIDGRIDAAHAAAEGLAGKGIHAEGDPVALADLGVIGLGDTHEYFHGDYLLDGEDGTGHSVHVTAIVVAGSDDAVDRRTEYGVLEQVVVAALADLVVELGGFVVALGETALLIELLEAPELGLGVDKTQLSLVELDTVHLRQDLACGHEIPYLDIYLLDAAAALGSDVVDSVGLDGGRIAAILTYVLKGGRQHLHGLPDGLRSFIGSLLVVLFLGAACEREGRKRYDANLLHFVVFSAVKSAPTVLSSAALATR